MVLVADRVKFSFQFKPILRDVCFEASPGEILKIEGPNGVGKTTLVKVIARLLSPQSGKISFYQGGCEFDDYRRFLEYLPAEGNGLFYELDALKNLQFWSRLRGVSADLGTIEPLLRHWGLGGSKVVQGFPVAKFSTGMKRRLALVRVILSDTRIWLLDEPLYGLDQDSIKLFRMALKEHIDKQGIVIMVSHDSAAFKDLQVTTLAIPKKRGAKV